MALRYVSYDTYPDVKLYTSYIDEYTSFTFLILEYISVNEEYRLEIVYFERKDNVFVMGYAPIIFIANLYLQESSAIIAFLEGNIMYKLSYVILDQTDKEILSVSTYSSLIVYWILQSLRFNKHTDYIEMYRQNGEIHIECSPHPMSQLARLNYGVNKIISYEGCSYVRHTSYRKRTTINLCRVIYHCRVRIL